MRVVRGESLFLIPLLLSSVNRAAFVLPSPDSRQAVLDSNAELAVPDSFGGSTAVDDQLTPGDV
jgi:hypothetical protein